MVDFGRYCAQAKQSKSNILINWMMMVFRAHKTRIWLHKHTIKAHIPLSGIGCCDLDLEENIRILSMGFKIYGRNGTLHQLSCCFVLYLHACTCLHAIVRIFNIARARRRRLLDNMCTILLVYILYAPAMDPIM